MTAPEASGASGASGAAPLPAWPYRGRFAPSPTGPLHAGSLVAALASWLDARAHGGAWLVRIEDIDTPRCVAGMGQHVIAQLAAFGLVPDAPPLWQSARETHYAAALARLLASDWAYPCACSRADIAAAHEAAGRARERHATLVYPGTCRTGLAGQAARAVRLRAEAARPNAAGAPTAPLQVDWHDRRLGAARQDVTHEVGDFVLRRADGLWAYQLAVVVDDAEQGITHVVRGEDLADNTPRQIHLQRVLGVGTPHYLHTPLVLGPDGQKLSKQNGAQPLGTDRPLQALQDAGATLGIRLECHDVGTWLARAVGHWRARWVSR